MDNQTATDFRKRITRAYENSRFTSLRSLSLACGWSESRVHAIISGNFDNSEAGPGFFGILRLCEALEITPDYLAGISKWSISEGDKAVNTAAFLGSIEDHHQRPSIKHVVKLFTRSGQRLEGFKSVIEYCDTYAIPNQDTETVEILDVGRLSLSALRMGEANPVILQDAYDNAPKAFQKQIFSSHNRAFNDGMRLEVDAIDQRMQNLPIHVKIDYIRLAMRVSSADGNEFILIYCELLPQ